MRLRALGSGLVVAAVLTFPGALQGQVSLGAGAGLAFTNLTGDDVPDDVVESKTGFYVGGSLGVPLGGILGFGTGAYYVAKGAKAAGGGDESFDLTYLEIPALLQVQVTQPERPVGVGLFLGPSFSFNLSCEDFDGDDCGDDTKSFELGAMFGGGLSFAAGQSATFSVNAGLDLGLTTVDASENESDIKNQAYFAGVGISFPMGG